MQQITMMAAAGIGGFILGLFKDVIVSWYKGDRNALKPECIKNSERLTALENTVAQQKAELKKGSAMFEAMRTDISDIKLSVGVLLDRADRRRVGDKS